MLLCVYVYDYRCMSVVWMCVTVCKRVYVIRCASGCMCACWYACVGDVKCVSTHVSVHVYVCVCVVRHVSVCR